MLADGIEEMKKRRWRAKFSVCLHALTSPFLGLLWRWVTTIVVVVLFLRTVDVEAQLLIAAQFGR